jgi:hypothetical protein
VEPPAEGRGEEDVALRRDLRGLEERAEAVFRDDGLRVEDRVGRPVELVFGFVLRGERQCRRVRV